MDFTDVTDSSDLARGKLMCFLGGMRLDGEGADFPRGLARRWDSTAARDGSVSQWEPK